MTLYHVTKKANMNSIAQNGRTPMQIIKNDLDIIGVYGFDTIEAARDFAYDNNMADCYAIYSFEASEVILDPEYDSGAYVVEGYVHNAVVAEVFED